MSFFMRALANPGPGYVSWEADIEDYSGTYAPSAIQAGSAVVTSENFSNFGKLGLDYSPVVLYLFNGNANDSGTNVCNLTTTVSAYTTEAVSGHVSAIGNGTGLVRSVYDGYLSIIGALTIEVIGVFMWAADVRALCSFGSSLETEAGNTTYLLQIQSDGFLQLFSEHGAGVNDTAVSTSTVPHGRPTHLAVTRNSAGTNISFYIDGYSAGTTTVTAPTGGTDTSNRFRVFANNTNSAAPLSGTMISCLKICASELTADQIRSEYIRSTFNRFPQAL